MDEDTDATQVMLEALFDVRVAVYEIREFLIGDDNESEEEAEEEDS